MQVAGEVAGFGHNGFIEPAEWAWQAAQSKAHSFVKLVVHTLRCLMKDGEQEANVSDERLAELTSLTVKSVRKYRKQAHDEGWINHRPGSGRGHNSTYQMVIPSRTLSQIASLIDIDKSRNERGTFIKGTNVKGTPKRVPLEGKVPTERVVLEEKWEPEGDLSESGFKKEIPPTPPKEKTTPNNKPTTTETREAVVEEIYGLNGATSLIVRKLAGWINPMMPDHRTARASVENFVSLYSGPIVRDAFGELEAKLLHGDIIAKPIPYLANACARRQQNAAEAAKPKAHRKPRPWD